MDPANWISHIWSVWVLLQLTSNLGGQDKWNYLNIAEFSFLHNDSAAIIELKTEICQVRIIWWKTTDASYFFMIKWLYVAQILLRFFLNYSVLTKRFLMSVSNTILPTIWCTASVTIFKKGCKFSASNYRSIRLNSICAKTMERILTKGLKEFIIDHNILPLLSERRICEVFTIFLCDYNSLNAFYVKYC